MTVNVYEVPKQFSICYLSDLHLDSPDCDKALLKRDLDKAKAQDAIIFINGDVFDGIFFTDKRFTAKHSNLVDNAIDDMIEKAVTFLKPYVENIYQIGVGNHETSILKYYHIDPVHLLIDRLNRIKKGPQIRHSGYYGYIVLQHKNKPNQQNHEKIYFHHGTGGSATVTKGAIDLYRIMAENESDVYWIGHKHTDPMRTQQVRSLNGQFGLEIKTRVAFITAGYNSFEEKKDYSKGYQMDWGKEKFYGLQTTGCAFMEYSCKNRGGRIYFEKTFRRDI